MQAEVHILHKSDFYQLKDFRCTCTECSISKLEQLPFFSICFVRSGFYEQRIFRKSQEMHVGRLIVSKPDIEYVVRHIDDHPDLCTSFNFTDAFYEKVKDHYKEESHWFFSNPDLQSLLLTSHADIEFIHQRILNQVKQQSSLEIDDLVIQLVEKCMLTMGNKPQIELLPENLKRHHLTTIEKARDYLFQNFAQNVSLQQLADHCCVSLFHFGRIFKSIMNASPYQYLTELRLSNAKLLLQSTQQSVTEIAFQCGFNSLEHFTTVFKQRFKTSPTSIRGSVKVLDQFQEK
jgi:AraC family transcriptional regulator